VGGTRAAAPVPFVWEPPRARIQPLKCVLLTLCTHAQTQTGAASETPSSGAAGRTARSPPGTGPPLTGTHGSRAARKHLGAALRDAGCSRERRGEPGGNPGLRTGQVPAARDAALSHGPPCAGAAALGSSGHAASDTAQRCSPQPCTRHRGSCLPPPSSSSWLEGEKRLPRRLPPAPCRFLGGVTGLPSPHIGSAEGWHGNQLPKVFLMLN